MSQSRASSLDSFSLKVDLSDQSNESSPLNPELHNVKLQVLISELSNKLDNAYYQIEQQNELIDKLKQTITLYEKTLNISNREIELLKDSMKAYNVLLNTLSEGVSPGQSKPEQSSNIFNSISRINFFDNSPVNINTNKSSNSLSISSEVSSNYNHSVEQPSVTSKK